jgi:hypothetical protein
MPLDFQNVEVNWGKGLDQKSERKRIPPGKLQTLINGEFSKTGSVNKRAGYTDLPVPAREVCTAFTRGDELVVHNDKGVQHFVSNPTVAAWIDANQAPIDGDTDRQPRYCNVSSRTIRGTLEETRSPNRLYVDSAGANGYDLYAWQVVSNASGAGAVTTNIQAMLVDQATGAVVLGPSVLDPTAARNQIEPQVIAIGNRLIIVSHGHPGTGDIYGWSVDVTAPPTSWPAGVALRADGNLTTIRKDICTDGTTLFVFFRTTTPGIRAAEFSATLVAGVTGETIINALDVISCYYHVTSGLVAVMFATSAAQLEIMGYTPGGLGFSNPANVHAVGGLTGAGVVNATALEANATDVYVMNSESATGTIFDHVKFNLVDITTDPPTARANERGINHLRVAGKAFTNQATPDTYHFPLAYESDIDPAIFMAELYVESTTPDVYEWAYYARLQQDVSEGVHQDYLGNFSKVQDSFPGADLDQKYRLAVPRRTTFEVVGGVKSFTHGIDQVTIDLVTPTGISQDGLSIPADEQQVAVRKDTSLISGGLLTVYDGVYLTENTPNHRPVINETHVPAGTHGYKAIYEFEDERGLLHRSGPSELVSLNLGGTGLTIDVTRCNPSLFSGSLSSLRTIRVVLYRTESGGSVFYRAGEQDYAPTALPSIIAGTGFVTIIDSIVDADIIDNEVLYTTGGIIENDAPPAVYAALNAKDRVWIINASDRREVWYSKLFDPGIAAEFAASLTQRSDDGIGELTAIASLDEKILFFHEDEIFVLFGDGPNNAGQQDTFSELERVTTPVGCINKNSVITTPIGVMFQSKRGIELIDRSLAVKFIGQGIETFGRLKVSSAVLHSSKSEVRFSLANATRDVLVYNYFFGQWGTTAISGNPATSSTATLWEDQHVMAGGVAGTTGDAQVQEADKFEDAGVFYAFLATTGWITFAGLSGYKRIQRLALLTEKKSEFPLTVTLHYDYDLAVFDAFEFPSAGIALGDTAPSGDGRYRIHLPRQKLTAIALTVADAAPHRQGVVLPQFVDTFSLEGLQFRVGLKKGLAKLRAERSE